MIYVLKDTLRLNIQVFLILVFILLFPGPINFSTVSGSEETRGDLGEEVTGPDDITESLFPFTEDSGPHYVESSLLRGQDRDQEAGGERDRVRFGE